MWDFGGWLCSMHTFWMYATYFEKVYLIPVLPVFKDICEVQVFCRELDSLSSCVHFHFYMYCRIF